MIYAGILDGDFGENLVAEIGFDGIDVGPVRGWQVSEYAFELVEGARARKHWLPHQHLAQNTAHRPHVHSFCVAVFKGMLQVENTFVPLGLVFHILL